MLNLMAIISQQSWRDILLTALLASSILYYFVFKNAADISSKNETQVTSEEERRRRRDLLAKIAEERAKAKRIDAATADDDVASSNRDKCITQEPKKVSAKVTSSSKQYHATSTEKKANATILPKEKVTKTVASNRTERKSPVQIKTKDVINNRVASAPKNEVAAKTGTIDTPKGINEPPKNKERDSKVEKSDVDTSKEVNNSSIGQADGDELTEKTVMDVDLSNNENNVATTLATTIGTEDAQENDQESITIHLIKSSSPRIELTIATDATPSQLRQAAADATDIPLAGLRLIFRGRMIVEKSSGSVVDEFGIDEGSALHVVGKPKTSAYVSSSTAPASQHQQQQEPRTSQSQQQDMTRLIHQGLQSNPNFFHYAAAAGNYELIQAAIRDGSFNTQLNRSDENDWTPLHEAIRGGHLHVVTLLLDEGGLDMHAITNQGDGFSPLSLSINYHGGDHQLTRMLRDRGGQEWPEDVDDDSESESERSSSSNDESNEEEDAERNPWRNS